MPEHDDDPGKRVATTASGSKPPEEEEDFSIYIHVDGVKVSAPWRIASYGEAGALAESDIEDLVVRFDLPRPLMQTLSRQLGYCLDEDAFVNLVEVNRRKAIDRAATRLEEAARRARRIEADIKAIEAALAPLDPYFSEGRSDGDLLHATQARVHRVKETSAGLHDAVDRLIKTPGAAADMAPHDKRRVWDKRRQYVVETCCHAWHDAGLPVAYTTVADGSEAGQRRGSLVAFIQTVVMRVTDPAKQLSGETLRKDIDRFKAALAEPDPLSMPPETG